MKRLFSIGLLSSLFLCVSVSSAWSQCAPLNPAPTGSFCAGQRAEFTITDSDPDNVYHWYRSDGYDLGYGESGDGRYFVSPSDIPSGTNSVSFTYQRERPESIGPSSTISMAGGIDASFSTQDYEMKFDAQSDFILDSITIYAKVYYADPSKTWGFEVRIATPAQLANNSQGQFSNWFNYRFTSTNFEKIVIPVNLLVKAGTNYTIQIKSGDATQNLSAADLAHWYATGSYSSTTYLTSPSQIVVNPQTKTPNGTSAIPLIQDWDITLLCPPVTATATLRSTGCCSPMTTNFQVNSPLSVVRDTDLPLTLTVTGTDAKASYYYEWFDAEKNLVPGSAGIGKTTLSISSPGVYYVRIVQDQAFVNSFSCYKENSVLVQQRILFATADKKSICLGESANLVATGATDNIVWSPATGLSATTTKSVTATPTALGKITYTVSATVPVGNLVIDGDFDASTSTAPKFETTYTLGATIPNSSPNGHAVVGTRAAADWDLSGKFCDDTAGFYTGDRGKFLFADAQSSPSNPVPSNWGITNYLWQQSNLPVEIGKTYQFRLLVTDWGVESLSDPAKTADLQLYINGVAQLTIPHEINKRCSWTEVKINWTATTDKATLSVADVNAQNIGGEFAIDDISFGAPGTQTDTVSITVNDCSFVTARKDTNACLGSPVKLTAVASSKGMITSWSPATGLDHPNTATPLATPLTTTTYTVEAKFPINQLFSNSDFTNGNTGITNSQFTYKSGQAPGTGEYGVYNGTEGYFYYPYILPLTDHTGGTGKFLLGNSSSSSDLTLHSQTIAVTAGTSYGVSFYLKGGIDQTYAWIFPTIQIKVANTTVATVTASSDGKWTYGSYTWTPAVSGNVTVSLVVPGLGKSQVFQLDDLVIASLGNPKYDDMTITIRDCFTLTASTDNVCHADSVEIKATTNGLFQGWIEIGGGTSSISAPSFKDTYVRPSVATKYVAIARYPLGNEVVNGDFELGNQGFSSPSLTYGQNNLGPGGYGVAKNPNTLSSYYYSMPDHTKGDGTGQMLVVDASSQGQIVYQTNADLVSGTEYGFSVWVADINNSYLNPPILTFVINGQDLPTKIIFPDSTHDWFQFNAVYTAPISKTGATIQLRNDNPSGQGNDFALDDVSFAPLAPAEKRDTIDVNPCRVCNKPNVHLAASALDTSLCQGSKLDLKGRFTNSTTPTSDKLYYLWYKKGGSFSSASYKVVNTATNVIPDTIINSAGFASSGTYILRVQDGKTPNDVTCYGEDSVKVRIDTVPSFTVKNTNLCAGNSLKLDSLVSNVLPKLGTLSFYADTTGTTPTSISSTVTAAKTYYAKVVSSSAKCTNPYKYGTIVVTGLTNPRSLPIRNLRVAV